MRDQRVSVLIEPGQIEVQRRSVPLPAPGDVQVRVEAVGICGSDVHYYRHGRIGDFVVHAPLVLGHEVGGVITAVGDGVDPSRIGERVALEPQRTNPWSEQSRLGIYNLDPDIEFFATPPYDGAFCEYVTIPSGSAFAVPETMTAEEAALIEPLAVAVAAIRHAGVKLGERVAITGAGPIGLLTAQLAQFAGASVIAVSDPLPQARERALRYGATETLDPLNIALPDAAFDVCIDASGVPAAIQAGIRSLRPRGRALLLGMGPDQLEIPFSIVQVRELQLQGVFRYANAWPTAITLASRIDLAGLVTSRYSLAEVPEALERSSEADQVKVMIRPEESESA